MKGSRGTLRRSVGRLETRFPAPQTPGSLRSPFAGSIHVMAAKQLPSQLNELNGRPEVPDDWRRHLEMPRTEVPQPVSVQTRNTLTSCSASS